MKGVVFTEFLEMVESKFNIEMVDHLLDTCELPSGGVYTAVGTYDHTEIVTLVSELHAQTEIPVPDLIKAFGRYLFGTFSSGYPQFFEASSESFSFLTSVEHHIHHEVRKLYPDAELPRFDVSQPDENTLIMDYHSARHLEDLAEGLIIETLIHYGEESSTIERAPVEGVDATRFTIRKQPQS